jgi:hypothetical protein
MQSHCFHCQSSFITKRKDKHFCSPSCKQMAFVKRKGLGDISVSPPYSENIPSEIKTDSRAMEALTNKMLTLDIDAIVEADTKLGLVADETSDITAAAQPNTLINTKAHDSVSTQSLKTLVVKSNVLEDTIIYTYITCNWLTEVANRFEQREYYNFFDSPQKYFYGKQKEFKWVSIHYRCLIHTLLKLSNIRTLARNDVLELTNAFTFLSNSEMYKALPANYPFKNYIIIMRDKLQAFCDKFQDKEYVAFHLKLETKQELFLQRNELRFLRISFNELQQNFNTEFNRQQSLQAKNVVSETRTYKNKAISDEAIELRFKKNRQLREINSRVKPP